MSPRRRKARPGGARHRTRGDHVLIIVENVPFSIDIRVRKQIWDLLEQGYRVSVITREGPDNDGARGTPGLSIHEYRSPRERGGVLGYALEYIVSFACAAWLAAWVRAHGRIAVVQLSQPPDIYFPIGWGLRLLGTRVLVDQRDLMPELYAARYDRPRDGVIAGFRWLERRSQGVADHTVCVNEYLRDRAVERGTDPRDVTIVRNGPVLSHVLAARSDPSLRRRRFLACWIGRMGVQDRLDLLIEAVDHLVHTVGRTDCGFVILGEGETLEASRALAARLRLDPWISFPGWVDEAEVFTYLATSDVGLDTSLQHEVSPVKAMEYMAFALPMLAFDLRQTRALAHDAAVLVSAGDVPAFADALDRLLDAPQERAALGAAGRDRTAGSLAWEQQVQGYLRAVEQLAGGSVAPEPRLPDTVEAP